jgi:alkylation response protein AidB-like acyl-CoA dehydrogenase
MSEVIDRGETVRLIRESAASLVPRGDLSRIRALRQRSPGFDRAVWSRMCEMGWAGLRVPEAAGGSGLGMAEFAALAEEFGAALAPEPLIACDMAARLLRGAPLAALLCGARIVIPAWQERANSLDPTRETRIADGRVSGRKMFVPMADGADAFLVTGQGGALLVTRDAPGLQLAIERTQDGGSFGTLTLAAVAGEPVDGDIAAALDEATLATAAMLLGVMERCFAITLDYLRTRQQFGRAIGSFQSLQHRAADLKIQIALTRARGGGGRPPPGGGAPPLPRHMAVSRAKARAAEAAMLVTRACIQLHGGIGYTDEADVGLFLRRAMVLANLYGSATVHRARFAACAPEQDDE